MSAVTSPNRVPKTAATRSSSPATGVPMTTLVGVELRKMTDTRAGKWLLIGLAAVLVIVLAVAVATGDAGARSFTNLVSVAQLPLAVLLPVLGVLAATSEWSQRTVLTTFSLVPSRGRVVASKTLASMVLAIGAVVVSLVVAAVFALLAPIAGSTDADWGLGLADLAQIAAFQLLNMLSGLALGTLLLNSALAIVLYFVLPTIWSGVTDAFDSLSDVQQWLDVGTTWFRLIDPALTLSGEQWAQVGATAALWIVVPMGIGLARVLRREVD